MNRFILVDTAESESEAHIGFIYILDDEIPYLIRRLAREPYRPFSEHYVNGQPKPIEEYFRKVVKE